LSSETCDRGVVACHESKFEAWKARLNMVNENYSKLKKERKKERKKEK
jgi:hypothetical protein